MDSDYTSNTRAGYASPQPASEIAQTILDAIVRILRYVLGFSFMVLSVALLYFILSEVFAAYENISANAFINTLIERTADKPLFYRNTPDSTVIIGEGGAEIACVFFAFLIASLAVRVACSFLTTGIRLLTLKTK